MRPTKRHRERGTFPQEIEATKSYSIGILKQMGMDTSEIAIDCDELENAFKGYPLTD